MSSSEIEGGKKRDRNSRSGEMAKQNSWEEWLPPGWTAEVRVRKSGKKDTRYTDPSSGLKLFSKPEVFRHLNNMETKRSKSNRKRNGYRGRKPSAINSVSGQLNFADGRANELMAKNQSSRMVGVLKDNENLVIHAGGKETSMICFTLPKAKSSEQREKSDPSVVVGALSAKVAGNGVENPGNKSLRHQVTEKNKREKPHLPRRASKRLAGIEVGPIAELKTNNRIHRVSARRLNEAEASKTENLVDSAAPEKCVEKRNTVDNGENKNADEERRGSPLNFSLKDLWTDPCVEFVIKTLMDAIPIENENQAEEDLRSSVEFPFGDSWGDPCIDFAVKTLTGAIPVVEDFRIPKCLLTSSSETKQDKGSEISNAGLHNSGDSGIHPYCEEKSDEHHRKTICW